MGLGTTLAVFGLTLTYGGLFFIALLLLTLEQSLPLMVTGLAIAGTGVIFEIYPDLVRRTGG